MMSWLGPEWARGVAVNTEGRVQRRDFSWQRLRYPDIKLIPSSTTVVVHPNIGVSEWLWEKKIGKKGEGRVPCLVPEYAMRLLKMWEHAIGAEVR